MNPDLVLFQDVQRVLRLYAEESRGSERRERRDVRLRVTSRMAELAARTAVVVALVTPAEAQNKHDWYHAFYQNWVNGQDKGCCNNQDCRELADIDERTTSVGRIEVRIEGVWCPVQAFHYLKSGNAPDWATAHVCVQKQVVPGATTVCARLLCYQPKPGI